MESSGGESLSFPCLYESTGNYNCLKMNRFRNSTAWPSILTFKIERENFMGRTYPFSHITMADIYFF